ncbi:MAG: hypothetical protein L3J39_14165 [Verrucomicrobiales bacterium]|nr:hypothetical protein [Verrucomicrobiales bacterium]
MNTNQGGMMMRRKCIFVSLVFLMVLGWFSASGQESAGGTKGDVGSHYDYLIRMPDFMQDFPILKRWGAGVVWEWWSKNRKIRVEHSVAVYPREVMVTADALNQAIETYRGDLVQNYSLMGMTPDFFQISQERYLYQKREGDKWMLAIAERTEDSKCTIAVCWVYGEAQAEVNAVLRAVRSGVFGRYELSFYTSCYARQKKMRDRSNGRLVIELRKGGDVYHKDKKISLLDITRLSREWVDHPLVGKARLHLRADKKSETQDIKNIVKAAADGGVVDVIFGTFTHSALSISRTEAQILLAHSEEIDELIKLVGIDPLAAVKQAERWPNGVAKDRALIRIAEKWARLAEDPEVAAAWVESLPEGETKIEALQRVSYYLVKKDLAAAMRWAEGLSEKGARAVKSRMIFHWPSRDIEEAVAWVEGWSDVVDKNTTLISLARRWAESAPEDASQWVEGWYDGEDKNRAMVEVAYLWSRFKKYQEVSAAAVWIDGWPDGKVKDKARKRVVSSWSYRDYKAAAMWIDKWSEGRIKWEAAKGVAERASGYEPQWVAAWVKTWADEKYQRQAYLYLIREWARKDPMEAAEWAGSLDDGDIKLEVYRKLVVNWSHAKDVDGAVKWVESLTDGVYKKAAIQGLIRKWVFNFNFDKAEKWIKGFPEGDAKYEANKELAKSRAILKSMPTAIE